MRLVGNGFVERVVRGLFRVAEAEQIEHCTVGAVCAGVPGVIVCLLSALSVHELTTQIVWQEWIAIEQKARTRRPRGLRVRVVRFSGTALRYGVAGTTIEGVPVSTTCGVRDEGAISTAPGEVCRSAAFPVERTASSTTRRRTPLTSVRIDQPDGGLRARIRGGLGRIRLAVPVDIGFADVITLGRLEENYPRCSISPLPASGRTRVRG